jgi:hypothetical protein
MTTLEQIQPHSGIVLDKGEIPYVEFIANRAGVIESVSEVSKSKKTGGITRTVGGGVLFGPIGAVAGAMTAGSKGESSSEVHNDLQIIDQGSLLITNQRVVFVGNDIVSMPFSNIKLINFNKIPLNKKQQYHNLITKNKSLESFNKPFSEYRVSGFRAPIEISIIYDGSLKGERYILVSKNAKKAQEIYHTVSSSIQ